MQWTAYARRRLRRLTGLDAPTLRAAWWALRAARRASRDSKASLPRAPSVGRDAERGVVAVLRRREDSCLVCATVRQAWLAAQGDRRDLLIGVRGRADGFAAHAWLDGDPESAWAGFCEIQRRPARA